MAFSHYSQNNSGGLFDFDEDAGITKDVVVEASSARMADAKLESIGGYFDGCASGRDCPCCGDRWSTAYGEGDDTPLVYGQPVPEEKGNGIAVHYLDGRVEWF